MVFNSCKTTELPSPESEWNRAGVWMRVSDDPATYVPSGYPAKAPRSESSGDWFKDDRDGKSLFVPSGGVSGWSEGVLRSEAVKVTSAGPEEWNYKIKDDEAFREYLRNYVFPTSTAWDD